MIKSADVITANTPENKSASARIYANNGHISNKITSVCAFLYVILVNSEYIAVTKLPTTSAPMTEIMNLVHPKPKMVKKPFSALIRESNYLNRLNNTIATPSFSVASPKDKLNKLLLTWSYSIIAITATGSIAERSEE